MFCGNYMKYYKMEKNWYMTFLVDVSKPPKKLIFRDQYNIDVNGLKDIYAIESNFVKVAQEKVPHINYDFNNADLRDVYLFLHIIDKIRYIQNIIYNSRDSGYDNLVVSEGYNNTKYEKVRGSMYRIYIKMEYKPGGFVNEYNIYGVLVILFGMQKDSYTYIQDPNLPSFEGRVEHVDDLHHPDDVWILDNKYIIFQNHGAYDIDVRGSLGVVLVNNILL
ncbi:Hypothetical protein ORPV_64 [Orpheovirus IHUMI-LCC2]|uniref:Uncharacterized protein n=1 Tax=Orpheovirus IHUMI-LCC2 TaxID=2023057 RepID=A0A2I2L353_9VIRU|nr:Hypothetical protein ORPV_64 [Orpheovirus IHUMI-LCC2]SNW61968.1 Hypothetical protein ORPV_64 [Orpheovirus IHUMI-LCC2]